MRNAAPAAHNRARVIPISQERSSTDLGWAIGEVAARPDDVEVALAGYEEAMFARSAAEAAEMHEILDLCLGERAPYRLIELFEGDPSSET
ncbi:hypothetical protein [Methylobacterium sp. C1]|uniref:hypothetical protein n=1 Tax=Methylobacterium sp. C1 TaxID=1479019 RepID=UPI0008DA96AB|nr:hypothetical protein [Methylobacterium sp. C1]